MMQLRPANFVVTVALTGLLVVVAIAYYNYRADRWGVYASDFRSFHEKIFVNKLYLKSRFLLNTEHNFDCFLFGSSRLAAIDARHFGETCYNFTHSGGLVADHVTAVRLLLEAGVPIRRVFIALDDLSYNENPEEGAYQHMRRAYPRNLMEYLGFNKLFVLQAPTLTDFGLFTGERPKVDTPRFIINPNLDTDRIRQIYQRFFDDPVANDARFRRLQGMGEGTAYHGDSSIAGLKELKALSLEYGFTTEWFFLPLHYKTYLKRNYDWFTRFRGDVAELQPFTDFSGMNQFTADNRYWRETSHFSAVVGDAIAEEVLQTESNALEFGRHLNAGNLQADDEARVRRDAEYLPLLALREGVLPIPERFASYWRSGSSLKVADLSVHQATEQGMFNPVKAHYYRLGREDSGKQRTAVMTLDLRKGEFFILSYEFVSEYPEIMNWQISQDTTIYGNPRKQFKLRVLPGENQGSYLGLASVDRPQLRLNVGGGNLGYDWRGLRLYRLSVATSAEQVIDEFSRLY